MVSVQAGGIQAASPFLGGFYGRRSGTGPGVVFGKSRRMGNDSQGFPTFGTPFSPLLIGDSLRSYQVWEEVPPSNPSPVDRLQLLSFLLV